MDELDHWQTSAAHHLDLVHSRDTLPQDDGDQVQHLSRRGCGQVDVGEDGVFGAGVVRRAFPHLNVNTGATHDEMHLATTPSEDSVTFRSD